MPDDHCPGMPQVIVVDGQFGTHRLKARLRPMRGLKQFRSAGVISVGHAFIQNVRRGHYELATDMTLTIGSRLRSPSLR